jgi:hypothetical protein
MGAPVKDFFHRRLAKHIYYFAFGSDNSHAWGWLGGGGVLYFIVSVPAIDGWVWLIIEALIDITFLATEYIMCKTYSGQINLLDFDEDGSW